MLELSDTLGVAMPMVTMVTASCQMWSNNNSDYILVFSCHVQTHYFVCSGPLNSCCWILKPPIQRKATTVDLAKKCATVQTEVTTTRLILDAVVVEMW